MPKTPSTNWYHQPFLWRAANARMLVRCKCSKCQRVQHYYAVDLVLVFGSDAVIGRLWGQCPRCGSSEFWSEQERHPASEDVANLVIRRPAGFRKIRKWRNEYFGPPPYGPPWPPPFSLGTVAPDSDLWDVVQFESGVL